MAEPGIPQEVRSFLRTRIRSVAELEVLLLLNRDPNRWWSPDQINRELTTSLQSAQQALLALNRAGLVEERAEPEPSFRFRAADEDTKASVALLAALFQDRMVSIVEIIYASRNEDIRAFADAFRWKKEGNDD